MERQIKFFAVATLVFAAIAAPAVLLLPPDVLSTFPATVAALVLCWPVAYWITYVHPNETAA